MRPSLGPQVSSIVPCERARPMRGWHRGLWVSATCMTPRASESQRVFGPGFQCAPSVDLVAIFKDGVWRIYLALPGCCRLGRLRGGLSVAWRMLIHSCCYTGIRVVLLVSVSESSLFISCQEVDQALLGVAATRAGSSYRSICMRRC